MRLDKKTGDIRVLVGNRLTKVTEAPAEPEQPQNPSAPSGTAFIVPTARTWPPLENEPAQGVTLRLKTKLRGTRLFYEFTVDEPKGLTNFDRRYTPVFRDADNLELFLLPLPALTVFEYGERDGKGKYTSVTHYGVFECSPELYEAATHWWVRSH